MIAGLYLLAKPLDRSLLTPSTSKIIFLGFMYDFRHERPLLRENRNSAILHTHVQQPSADANPVPRSPMISELSVMFLTHLTK